MKRLILLGALLAALLAFVGCQTHTVYPRLDGMWQLQRLEFADGTVGEVRGIYYSFQMQTVQLRKVDFGSYFGAFVFSGDSLHLHIVRTQPEVMDHFGLNDTVQHFSVPVLTGSRLVLRSDYSTLTFHKY